MRRAVASGAPLLFRLAPYSSSAPNISASSTRAASRSGETSAARHGEGSAPYSSSIRSAGAAPTLPLVMVSADRRSSDRALTSAPASSRTRIVSRSGAAHISAVAPALLAALGSAPAASSRFTSAASPVKAAAISGVAPPAPRDIATRGWPRSCASMPARSPLRIACIRRTASASAGGGGVSPEAASGQIAPSSIHCLMISVCSRVSGPGGGICWPNAVPIRR